MPRKKASTTDSTVATAPKLDYDKPNQHLKPHTFFDYLAGYPNTEGMMLYVYRLWPKIDRKLAGIDNTFIEKTTEPITEADLMRRHGSGSYMLILSDSNFPKGLSQRARTKVVIDDPDYPPVVDLQELVVTHPENKSYVEGLRARGVSLGDDDMKGSDSTAVLADTVKDLTTKILAGGMQDKSATAPVQDGGLNAVLLQGFVTMTKTVMDMATKIQDKPAPAPPPASAPVDPFDTFVRVSGQLKEMGLLRNASAVTESRGAGASDWLTSLPAILDSANRLLLGFASLRGTAAASGTAQPAAVQPVAATAAPEAEIILPEGELDMNDPRVLLALQKVGERALKAFELGIAGDAFAQALCRNPQDERLYDLLAQLGKDGLMQVLGMVPGLAPAIAARRLQVEEFISSFVSYGEVEADQAETEGGK